MIWTTLTWCKTLYGLLAARNPSPPSRLPAALGTRQHSRGVSSLLGALPPLHAPARRRDSAAGAAHDGVRRARRAAPRRTPPPSVCVCLLKVAADLPDDTSAGQLQRYLTAVELDKAREARLLARLQAKQARELARDRQRAGCGSPCLNP